MAQNNNVGGRARFVRFWASASGFWKGQSVGASWALTVGLIAVALAQLAVQYRLNY
jgi:vitamin B12/bleomycin/antimicrobial peptide transport system ATP-binding/permease protein